ncbi:MAG TPA: glycosyltransferase [Solirubrobacteraceae bacterium]|nr:glycosyltransferase [Solirubrobacteraceae bacterium]
MIDALAARFGGTAYSVVQLAPRLARRPGINGVCVITRENSMVDRGLRDLPGVRVLRLAERRPLELVSRVVWEALRLPRRVAAMRPVGLLTFSGMLPRAVPSPTVAYLCNPLMFSADGRAGDRTRVRAVSRTLARGATAAVPSHGMARLVAKATGARPAVAPLGVDHSRFTPGPQAGTDVLYVADFYPHKRHDLLLEAWSRLPAPRPRLRLVGNPDVSPRQHAEIVRRAGGLSSLGEVTVERGLSLTELVDAYRAARVTVVPSTQESFCMPLAETLAAGTPAVARDLPALRETAGGGARYVADDDPERWAAAMAQVLRDDGHHAELRRAGAQHVRRFTWDGLAERLGEALGLPDR